MIAERLGALQDALNELRAADQALLRSVEWEGLSMEEAAQRHDLTVPAWKSRLFRIRRQLKELVGTRFSGHTADAGRG